MPGERLPSTFLFGACALSGEVLEPVLDAAQRARLRARFPALPQGIAEFESPLLWIAAGKEKLAKAADSCAAYEGFMALEADGRGSLERFLEGQRGGDAERLVRGHYALAVALRGGRSLTLLRDPSGGESLYYARWGRLLVFSASARLLRELPGLGRGLDESAAAEFLLQGSLGFNDRTLYPGIRSLLPGWRLRAEDGTLRLERHWRVDGSGPGRSLWGSPKAMLDELRDATAQALGADQEVGVALSGGLDSATIALLATELLGPRRVQAFTYEFDDQAHPSEAARAQAVCRALGIRHHIVRLSFKEVLDTIPIQLWMLEEIAPLARVRLWLMARRTASLGLSKTLTGHGIEQLLGLIPFDRTLEALARAAPKVPWPALTLRGWGRSWGDDLGARMLRALLKRLPEGLAAPNPMIYRLAARWLDGHAGGRDMSRIYPAALRPLLSLAETGAGRVTGADGLENLSSASRLRHLNYEQVFQRSTMGKARLTREAGSTHISPAAFLHPHGVLPLWFAPDGVAPGRALQRAALQGRIPDSVVQFKKIMLQAVYSEDWFQRIQGALEPVHREFTRTEFWKRCDGSGVEALLRRRGATFRHSDECVPMGQTNPQALALWHKLFVELDPADGPPTWEKMTGM